MTERKEGGTVASDRVDKIQISIAPEKNLCPEIRSSVHIPPLITANRYQIICLIKDFSKNVELTWFRIGYSSPLLKTKIFI